MNTDRKHHSNEGKSVTSYGQQGGITAFEVHSSAQGNPEARKIAKGMPLWVRWLVAIFTILGAVAGVVFGLLTIFKRGG